MAAKGKKVRILIRMVCTEGTGHFYTTTKNPRTSEGKLEKLMYNPVLRRKALYREAKIK